MDVSCVVVELKPDSIGRAKAAYVYKVPSLWIPGQRSAYAGDDVVASDVLTFVVSFLFPQLILNSTTKYRF